MVDLAVKLLGYSEAFADFWLMRCVAMLVRCNCCIMMAEEMRMSLLCTQPVLLLKSITPILWASSRC